jgi:hypothetical protein
MSRPSALDSADKRPPAAFSVVPSPSMSNLVASTSLVLLGTTSESTT